MTNVDDLVQTLIGRVMADTDETVAIKARMKAGEITEEKAVQELLEVLAKDPEILAFIEGSRVQPENRLPRVDPLVEAALIERAQFDGDMPELRTGPWRPNLNTAPAVPVALTSRDPVVGGLMLQRASENMQKKLMDHDLKRLREIETIYQKALPTLTETGAIVKQEEPDVFALVHGSAGTDLPEYKRGEVPAMVKVEITGSDLAALSPAQRQEAAWKLLSTTQGRRSAQPVIEQLVKQDLEKRGFEVQCREAAEVESGWLADHKWTLKMSGPSATQASFNFIDMAARCIATGLRTKWPKDAAPKAILELTTVSRLEDRVICWSARLFPG